jgi:hypothetical protein
VRSRPPRKSTADQDSTPGAPPWGRVFIVAGRWKGRRGYYDDDECGGYCIVYPDGVDGYVLVRPTSIVEAPEPDDTIH